jgi:diamine N-acetyltransferase
MRDKNSNNDIKFRCLEYTDAEKLFILHNNQLIKNKYSGHPFPVSFESTKEWIRKVSEPNNKLSLFGIDVNNELVGVCGLKAIDHINSNAELFIYLDPSQQGKGIASQSVAKLLDFGFGSLNINRIYLHVQADNMQAIKLYKSNNFFIEGELRKAVFKNNKYTNVLVMAILKEEFLNEF